MPVETPARPSGARRYFPGHELPRNHRPLARAAGGGTPRAALAGHPAAGRGEHGV